MRVLYFSCIWLILGGFCFKLDLIRYFGGFGEGWFWVLFHSLCFDCGLQLFRVKGLVDSGKRCRRGGDWGVLGRSWEKINRVGGKLRKIWAFGVVLGDEGFVGFWLCGRFRHWWNEKENMWLKCDSRTNGCHKKLFNCFCPFDLCLESCQFRIQEGGRGSVSWRSNWLGFLGDRWRPGRNLLLFPQTSELTKNSFYMCNLVVSLQMLKFDMKCMFP